MGTIAKVTAGGATHYIASSAYCICTTAAATAAKVANLIGDQADNASTAAFTLIKGTTVHVKFTYGNTAGSATLNVGGTGAKNICRYGTTAVGTNVHTSWRDGAIVSFTYDGTSWVMNNYIENTDTNTTALGSMSGTLAIGHGGTGATDAATARSNLGITPGNIGAATSGHTHTTSLASGGTSTINLAANTAYTLTAGGTSVIFKTPPDNNTTYSFSDKNVTLAWGTKSTIATVGGTDIHVTMPANPNTNTTYSAGTGLSLSGTTFSAKLGYTTSGNNRAVQADSNGNLYVTQKDDNTTYSFTAGTSTLAWNSEVTLATVGGLAIKAKLPANPNTDHYAWGDITSKPATATRWPTWDEVTGKPSTFAPSSHTHSYAGSDSAGGPAQTVKGAYTGNGGQQNPSYFGKNKVGFLMMNTTVNSNTHYKDWIIMDSYNGTDVGGSVAFGVNRQALGAYIMRSAAERSSWAESAELIGTHNYTSYTVKKDGTGASGTWGINVSGSAGSVAWGNVTGKPSSFTPASHTHTTSLAAGGTSTINLAANTAYTLTAGGTSIVFKTPADNNTTYSFSDKNVTLAWGTKSTIATVGGTDIHVTMPANPNTDHYAWGDITGKPSSFTPASHTHNYAGSSSAGGAATSLANFKVSTTSNLWAVDSPTTNAVGYQSGLTKANWNYQQTDGALYSQFYNSSWVHEIFGDYRTGQISVRGKNNGTWQSWRRILDESNAATILGLGSAAYTASTAYAAASHTHSYAASNHTHTTSLAASGSSGTSLAANTWYTLTAGGTTVTFKTPADNNTWRGIVNNLTSNSTTDSLSAAQGKALKALVDGKAATSHGNHVPTTQTANNAIFLRNDNTWQTVTPGNIGAATSGHTHGISIAADSGTNQLTLAASTKYKLTAGGSSYIFTTPPNTNTDTKVTQTAISTERGAYPILFAGSTSTSTATEGAKKASTLWFQAEEDALYANSVQTTDLNGVFVHTDVANNYVIYANQWTSGICELTHSCTVTDKTLITISPGFSITAEELKAYQSANIVGIGQNATTFKLKCFGSVPTISIPINVGIFNS